MEFSGEATVHLWPATLNDSTLLCNFSWLSRVEQIKAERFHFPQHKVAYVIAHVQLRLILSYYLHVPPAEIKFSYNKNEKPFLSKIHQSPIQFNLSHSKEKVYYAICQSHAVGVDVEYLQTPVDIMELSKYTFSLAEHELLRNLNGEERTAAFFRIWTSKEAIVKAMGVGLSLALDTFTIPTVTDYLCVYIANQPWFVWTSVLEPNYRISLAHAHPLHTIEIWQSPQTPQLKATATVPALI